MKLIAKSIRRCDGYGQNLQLNINGQEKVRSFIGGFCYLLYIMSLLSILGINLYKFFYLPNPLITYSEMFRDQIDFERISPENLMFSNFFVSFNPSGAPIPIETIPVYSEENEINLKYFNGKVKLNPMQFGEFGDCEGNKVYLENKKFKPIYDKLKNYSKEKFFTCFNVTKDYFSIGGNILTENESSSADISSYYNLCDFLKKEKNVLQTALRS